MAQMDWEKERQRLASLYAGMEDAELQEIATRPESLTDVARQVLRSELSKRGMPPLVEKSESAEPKRSDAPVMIRRFQDLPEALLSKSILDSAGIESFLADENLVRIDWFYSNLVGGIKLLVRAEDADTAGKLLAQETLGKFDVDGVGEYKQPRCPQCQSLDVAFDELNKRVACGSVLFAGSVIPENHEHWKCNTCGQQWKDSASASTRRQHPKQ